MMAGGTSLVLSIGNMIRVYYFGTCPNSELKFPDVKLRYITVVAGEFDWDIRTYS